MGDPGSEASEHPNARLARAVWDALARGDAGRLLRLYAPDVVLCARGVGPVATSVHGAEAALDYLATLAELVDELRSDVLEVFAGPSGAALQFHISAHKGEHKLESDMLLLMRMKGGRVTHLDLVPLDAGVNARFWTAAVGSETRAAAAQ